jgi:hypothetical protein
MIEITTREKTNPNAILSLVLGIVTLAVIPFLSLLVAPCGFPLSLVTGISAIILGGKGKKETGLIGYKKNGLASAGILTGWLGIAINTVVMLIKLAMFVVIFGIPFLAIIYAGKAR